MSQFLTGKGSFRKPDTIDAAHEAFELKVFDKIIQSDVMLSNDDYRSAAVEIAEKYNLDLSWDDTVGATFFLKPE